MITFVLIGITVLISMYAFNKPDVMRRLILHPYTVKSKGQYYRFITSGFIHKDHVHLIFNMITLYFFGQYIEAIFLGIFGTKGAFYFVALYLLAIVVSDISSYFKYRHNPAYSSLGASGGVSAIVFAFILFLPLEKINLYLFIPIPGFILGALYLMYSYFQGRRQADYINHDAHLYGALFGLIFCVILYPPVVINFIDQLRNWRIF